MISNKRHIAREIILKAIFAKIFLINEDKEESDNQNSLLDDLISDYDFKEDLKKFIYDTYNGIIENVDELDSAIQMHAPSFPLDKIAKIDLCILRLGGYELLYSDKKNVPSVVAINESIELAKAYGSENSPKFVNAVLNAIMKKDNL